MSEKNNYSLEEYKMLKDEAKSFTNQTFRDFQLFIAIITLFLALISTADKDHKIPTFTSYAFMQVSIFVFILIQFNRVTYLLIIRRHLEDLERILNKGKDDINSELIFRWESKIVPIQISPVYSYSTFSQFLIGLTYLLVFCILCWQSSQQLKIKDPKNGTVMMTEGFYHIILWIEFSIIAWSLINIVIRSVFKIDVFPFLKKNMKSFQRYQSSKPKAKQVKSKE